MQAAVDHQDFNEISNQAQPLSTPPCRALVDLSAVRNNYLLLKQQSGNAECSVVLKANAYGLGLSRIAPELYDAGARTFFVAYLSEALQLKNCLSKNGDYRIFVFEGPALQSESDYTDNDILPVINSMEQVNRWRSHLENLNYRYPCALHVDTGMNRLGLSLEEFDGLAENLDDLNVELLISHLSCADTPGSAQNERQLRKFKTAGSAHSSSQFSLANSSGIFLGPKFHFDLVRPGISLFGGSPDLEQPNPMHPVLTIQARLNQIRHIQAGEPIGYGASFVSEKPMCLGTLSMGYADGYPRSLSDSGAIARYNGRSAPVVGRINMDSIVVDLSEFGIHCPKPGEYMNLVDSEFTVDDIARAANTISYEILTRLAGKNGRLEFLYQSPEA